MNKQLHLIIDFDNTLVNSHLAIYRAYQQLTKDFTDRYEEDDLNWIVRDICPLFTQEEINNVFSTKEFYDNLIIYDDVIDTLKYFQECGHTIEICSLHKPEGIKIKEEFINKNFSFADKITISPFNKSMDFNKSHVPGDIIIDDNLDCLKSSNCKYKVCYNNNNNYNWCKSWDGVTTTNWKEVKEIIDSIMVEN